MPGYQLKTKETKHTLAGFLERIEDEERRKDCRTLVRLMKTAAGAPPKMWGPGMVGFGRYRYKYASGHEGEWFLIGFAPRRSELTLYLMGGCQGQGARLKKLGRHKTGKGCLYLRGLADVDLDVLESIIEDSVADIRKRVAAQTRA